MNNYQHNPSTHTHAPIGKGLITALSKQLSSKEDYRRGSYYVKHVHQLNTDIPMYLVFKDNPAPGRNWRGDRHLFFALDLEECVDWIGGRRCFKNN